MSGESSEPQLDEVVAVMAHDINNPLAALVTNLSFLEGELGPDIVGDAADALADAQMLCDVLRRLAGNLDVLARRTRAFDARPLRSGEPSSAPKPPRAGAQTVDLAVVVRDAARTMGKQAAAAELELVLDPALRYGDVFVFCDRDLCARAIDNLLAFAIERAPVGARIVVTVARAAGLGEVLVRFPPRPERGALGAQAGLGLVERRRQMQARYGRGLSLYCVRIAAALFGGRLDEGREADGQTRLCLVAPGAEER